MRVFRTLQEAESEIRRDLYKSPKVVSSRVQNLEDQALAGREALGYSYTITDSPAKWLARDFVEFGQERGFPLYIENLGLMKRWMVLEAASRFNASVRNLREPPDLYNPALAKVVEGEVFSYHYRERTQGIVQAMTGALKKNPDSRRVFWPIYREVDARRMDQPTRIPCSIGYQPLIRNVNGEDKLLMFYIQRSCDFDYFWLSDVFFATNLQYHLARTLRMGTHIGAFIHQIVSFHTFFSEGTEIY